MRSRRTAVNYSESTGLFRVTAEIPGRREPLARDVRWGEIEAIGDMDLMVVASRDIMCPGRDVVVMSPMRCA